MRTAPRRALIPQLLAGCAAAGALFVWFTLPPRGAHLTAPPADRRIVRGAFHVHSMRSDGSGDPDAIAQSAADAGLQFVILTDHGDATRAPDAPAYRHGVLTIDAVEISTSAGHLVALGLNEAAPYPLAGQPREVMEDVHRLGGWAVIAHPDSPKPDLRWRTWNVPYDGVEWLNVDSEWRDEPPMHLAGTFARYFLRGPEVIASLFRRPIQTLRRWDMAARTRAVTALAALDAHARLPWRDAEDGRGDGTLAALPSYRQMFRTLSQSVVLDRPLSGDARVDAAAVLGAMRAGRTYSVIDAFASPGVLEFQATVSGSVVPMGGVTEPSDDAAAFHAGVNDSAASVRLLANGIEVARGSGEVNLIAPVARGAYRVEVYRPGAAVPWIVSNPIFAGTRAGDDAGNLPQAPPDAVRMVPLPGAGEWAIERNETSTGSVSADGAATRFDFALGPGAPFNQYAALTTGLDAALAQEGFDRVRFTVRADHPTRFSVQLRLPAGQRWRHSVYADQTPREVTALIENFEPAERNTSHRPIVTRVRSVLFVVDTLNNRPSSRGTIWLSDVGLGVGDTGR